MLEKFGKVINSDDIELIIVDNGSEDNTLKILEELIPKYSFVKLEKVKVNKGYGSWGIASSLMDAANGSDAIVLLTEWDEFLNINWKKLIKLMRKPAWVFDTRSCIDYKSARKAGLNVWKIGNSPFLNE